MKKWHPFSFIWPIDSEGCCPEILEHLHDLRGASYRRRVTAISQHISHDFKGFHVKCVLLAATIELFKHLLLKKFCGLCCLIACKGNWTNQKGICAFGIRLRHLFAQSFLYWKICPILSRMSLEMLISTIANIPHLKYLPTPVVATENEVGIWPSQYFTFTHYSRSDRRDHCIKNFEHMSLNARYLVRTSFQFWKCLDCKANLQHHRESVTFVSGKRHCTVRACKENDLWACIETGSSRYAAVRDEHHLLVVLHFSYPRNRDCHARNIALWRHA